MNGWITRPPDRTGRNRLLCAARGFGFGRTAAGRIEPERSRGSVEPAPLPSRHTQGAPVAIEEARREARSEAPEAPFEGPRVRSRPCRRDREASDLGWTHVGRRRDGSGDAGA